MNKINLGIIGLGQIGQMHLANALFLKNANVVAVADKSKIALKKAENRGIKNLYRDYQDLFEKEKDLDAIIISLPNFLHYNCIVKAFEVGLDVFIEKPLANSVDECKEICKLEKKNGRKLMLGFNMRFNNSIEKMKTSIDDGMVGSIEYMTLESIQNGPLSHGRIPKPMSEWWLDPKLSGGGALIDLGCHLIDIFNYFTGDAKVIFSRLDYKMNLPVEDGATVILQSENSESRGIINVGWFQKTIFPKFNFRVLVHGNADFLSSELMAPRNLYVYAAKVGIKNFFKRISGRRINPLEYTYWYESYYKEINHFVECMLKDESPKITAVDGLKNIDIIDQAYKMNDNKLGD